VSVHLPNVTHVGNEAFACMYIRRAEGGVTSKLQKLSLPKCTYAGFNAFANLPNLSSIELPSLVECGYNAFACGLNFGGGHLDRPTLTSLSLPSLTAISERMLGG